MFFVFALYERKNEEPRSGAMLLDLISAYQP
jgi:hypothetical protein